MVFKKTIVQQYTNTTPFDFIDFVRGTISLIQYALNNDMVVRLNLEGSPFSQYLIVDNYNTDNYLTKLYCTSDAALLYGDLDAFKSTDAALFVVTTNWTMNAMAISNYAILEFKQLIEYSQSIYDEAITRVANELLNIHLPHTVPTIQVLRRLSVSSQPSDTDYSMIYVDIDPKIKFNYLDTVKLADTIRSSLLFDRNILLISNDKCLTNSLSEMLEVNYIPGLPDDIDDTTDSLTWTIKDTIVNFILLSESKKLYVFTERSIPVKKEYDIAAKMLYTSVQSFGFFYSKVNISPMPGFELTAYNSRGLDVNSSISDNIFNCSSCN